MMRSTSVFLVALVAVPLLSPLAIGAQEGGGKATVASVPEIGLRTDKGSYLLGEPVVLNIELRNTSGGPQQYGPLDVRYGKLRVRVRDTEGNERPMFESAEGYTTGWWEDASTAVAPGDSRSASFVLTHYYDISGTAGQLEIEVGYPRVRILPTDNPNVGKQETDGYETRITRIVVKQPEEADLELAERFSAALREHLGNVIPKASIPAAYHAVVDSSDSYLREPAAFYLAHYYESVSATSMSEEDCDEARSKYRTFLRNYPDSVFTQLARSGLETVEFRKTQIGPVAGDR